MEQERHHATSLARAIDVGATTVMHWLSGPANPRAENVRRICVELNVDPTWLLGIDKRKAPVDLEGDTKRWPKF